MPYLPTRNKNTNYLENWQSDISNFSFGFIFYYLERDVTKCTTTNSTTIVAS